MMYIPTSRNQRKSGTKMCFARVLQTVWERLGRDVAKGAANLDPDERVQPNSGKKTGECAIFETGIPDGFQRRRKPVSNGPRRPSEATTASFGPKYCKIRKRAFYGVFRPEKRKHRTSLGKSTDVCPQKYGCFALRSPMFLKPKRPDFALFSSKTRVFQRKLNLSLPFSENQNTTN